MPEARDPRLRIEHAQVVRKQDVARFAELGVIASMQPSHASDDLRWADARLGSGRVDGAYAWRWFVQAGVKLAHGSDFPVEIVNPFWGIYAGITRQDAKGNPPGGWHPEQKLTLGETLSGFTSGAAYAAFAEDRLGILKPSYRADLTVIDRDLFQADPASVLGSRGWSRPSSMAQSPTSASPLEPFPVTSFYRGCDRPSSEYSRAWLKLIFGSRTTALIRWSATSRTNTRARFARLDVSSPPKICKNPSAGT